MSSYMAMFLPDRLIPELDVTLGMTPGADVEGPLRLALEAVVPLALDDIDGSFFHFGAALAAGHCTTRA
jgi:hypothetical protein